MDTDETPTHRSVYEHPGEYVEFRDADELDEDGGMMAIRMPIASTGEVRNEGDDPLTASELRGMATQINGESRGVFLEHGMADAIDRASYTQTEKLGYWTDGDLTREASDDGEDLLMATARMPDPETLPAATDEYRTTLAIIKEQARRGIPIMSSIGWRDDESMPGGVDLLETSIVGIAADPRTNTEDDAAEVMARAAVDAGADPQALVDAVHAAVGDADTDQSMTDDDPGDDDAGTDTEDEQTADDGETESRAPEDVGPADFAEFVASHYDGLDSADVTDALDEAGGDYVGGVDVPELAAFVAEVSDADTGTVQDALDDLMGGENSDERPGDHEDEDGEDDDEEQSADTDGEQSADGEGTEDGEETAADRALEERIDDLEEELSAVRAGKVDIDTDPGDVADELLDDERDGGDETDEQRDGDDDGSSTPRDEWLSEARQ